MDERFLEPGPFWNRHSSALWDAHAAADPLWAVLSEPEKKGRRWGLQEFMRTGEREIALLYHKLAQMKQTIPEGLVLDFGCGVGRLTQALGRRRDQVIGADISPAMIEIAERLNHYPGRVRYVSTVTSGLDEWSKDSFALIYSSIVLQHVEPDLSVAYLCDFFKLVRQDGFIVFQLPSHQQEPEDMEIKPMPDTAYRAVVELAAPVPERVAASSDMSILLRVRNISGHCWSQPMFGPMAVGNHWLDATGDRMVQQDDARAPLLQVVEPGYQWPVVIAVKVPDEAGEYIAEIDLVHEGVTWFEYKGSRTLRFPVAVDERAADLERERAAVMQEYSLPYYPEDAFPDTQPDAPEPEPFTMHGVPHEQVLAVIKEQGGTLLHLEQDRRSGSDWVSYQYFVKGSKSS